jgi:hypothetical protein
LPANCRKQACRTNFACVSGPLPEASPWMSCTPP